MDESKLSKSDANRKPRELWIDPATGRTRVNRPRDERMAEGHESFKLFREILPQDDSIRVSREDWEKLQLVVKYDRTYFYSDIKNLMERIERESRSEG